MKTARERANEIQRAGWFDIGGEWRVERIIPMIEQQDAEAREKELKAPGPQPDFSPGDVISAEKDGTIVLDDGITTWNPTRACEFLLAKERERLNEVRNAAAQWRQGEVNSPYGVDEYGTKIPRRDGNQCADEIDAILDRKESGGSGV